MKFRDKKTSGVARILTAAKNEDELIGLLEDLFTEAEISKAHERIKIFACLHRGLSQRETQHCSRAAIATVSHGAKYLRKQAVMIPKVLNATASRPWWNALFWRI